MESSRQDGRPQREYTITAETSSPTISLEAMMQMCAIDVKEGRYVTVNNMLGDFLHADMSEDVHMVLEGTIAKPIIKLEPKLYRKYVMQANVVSESVTVQLLKSLILR